MRIHYHFHNLNTQKCQQESLGDYFPPNTFAISASSVLPAGMRSITRPISCPFRRNTNVGTRVMAHLSVSPSLSFLVRSTPTIVKVESATPAASMIAK